MKNPIGRQLFIYKSILQFIADTGLLPTEDVGEEGLHWSKC